jgi:hypothetical protein
MNVFDNAKQPGRCCGGNVAVGGLLWFWTNSTNRRIVAAD